MLIHHGIENLPAFTNAVLTLGSFDGVHLGHKGIIEKMMNLSSEINGETVVVTFTPHPRQVIYPRDKTLRLLSTNREKSNYFGALGIDHLIFCPFTVEFSHLSADEYIEKFIVQQFNPAAIVIGYDHRFGLHRKGNIDYLRNYERKSNFKVYELPQKMTEELQISSTRIRNFLLDGNIKQANILLGHPYHLTGKVIEGEQIGEKLGYPTANIEIENPLKLLPADGIYAVQVVYGNRRFNGMMYIGKRPTVSQSGKKSVEVNIFDFTEDIYGEELTLEILKFIRDDEKFDNLESLRRQLDKDKYDTQSFFDSDSSVKKRASILILNYNGREHLEYFLPSVVRSTSTFEIVVADNGSDDDSVSFLETQYPGIKILRLSKNYGFAEGYNQAIKKVNSEYIVLLNSDVEVTTNWVNKLIDFISERPDVAVVQPKVLSSDRRGKFEYAGAAGGLLDALGYPFCQGRILSETEEDMGQYDQAKEIFWTSGAAMVIKKDLFEKSGGFDVDFFAHMEEIDLCWRLKRAGYKSYVIPSAVVYHKGGGTLSYLSAKKTYLNFRNGFSLLLKNEKGTRLIWLLPLRLGLDLVALLRFVAIGEFKNAAAVVRALTYTIVHFPSIWEKRQKIKLLVERIRIGIDNSGVGRYSGSIVWEFFVMGRKKYHDLRHASNKYL